MRCFAALDIDNDVRNELVRFQEELREEYDLRGKGYKWVEPDNIHVTLKFLGEVSDQEIVKVCRAIEAGCVETSGFGIDVRGAGCFARGRVVWAGADGGEELFGLHEVVEDRLGEIGFERDRKKFKGHITLCRIKDFRLARDMYNVLAGYGDRKFGDFWVESVCVYKSELTKAGPVYNLIQRTML